MNETTPPENGTALAGRDSSELLADAERSVRFQINMAVVPWFALFLLAIFGVIHWAVWMPGLIANTGLLISLGMQLNRIDELHGS